MSKDPYTRQVNLRLSGVLFRKLLSICKATGKTKTAVIRDLISEEYEKNKKYEKWYYSDLKEE